MRKSRLIDADKLIEQIKKTYCEGCDNYNGMRCKACPNDDEIKDIDSAPTIDAVSEWIPCSERLPKIGEHHISEPCIVYCKGGVYAFAELEENIFGQVGWNCERDDDYHEPIDEVLAWMPLPKPYEERKDQ